MQKVQDLQESLGPTIKTKFLTGFLIRHIRVIIGHLHRLEIPEDVIKRFCGIEEETTRHLLMNCDAIEASVNRAGSIGRHQIKVGKKYT